jgi:outer membrane protein OmpA-like peptidoglycan-associated protein
MSAAIRSGMNRVIFKLGAVMSLAGLMAGANMSRAQDMGPMMPHEGGKIVTAFANDFGPDAEGHFVFTSVTPQWINLEYTSTRGLKSTRTIDAHDRQKAHVYVTGFADTMPAMIPGTTSLGISGEALVELRDQGSTVLAIIYDTKMRQLKGQLKLAKKRVKVPIIVEDRLLEVPAVQATGQFGTGSRTAQGQFLFLDNQNNPLMLESIVKYSWEDQPRIERIVRVTAGASMRSEMEQALETLRKYDIYGIHFEFDSARILGESSSIVKDVATTLKNNPLWTLQINGHTDSIGDEAYNQQLSRERAAAVESALVRLGVDPKRLKSVGLGESKPKGKNATLQGRALNRRVELVRTDR